MANLIQNPGFETDTDWTFGPTGAVAGRSDIAEQNGTYGCFLIHSSSVLGTFSGYAEQTLTTEASCAYNSVFVSYKTASEESGAAQLKCYLDFGQGGGWELLDTADAADDWTLWDLPIFSAEGTSTKIRFLVSGDSYPPNVQDIWYLDDAGVYVSIELAERAIDAVVSTLQTNLGTELTAIETEQGDGLEMDEPANADYYKRPKPEISGSKAHVEVFEEGFELDNPYTDISAQRLAYDIPISIRVTYFARAGETVDEMWTKGRRYGAAIARVLIENETLGGSDDALKLAFPRGYVPPPELLEGESESAVKMRISIPATVRCEEVNS